MREICLIAGISEADFWEMTVGEAARACDAYHERRRERAYIAYTEAMTVGLFIGSMFSNHAPPKLHEIYPEFFSETEEKEQEAREAASEANFVNFANAFNQRYKPNGDRTTESEDNG